MAMAATRKSYTAEFKLQVVQALAALDAASGRPPSVRALAARHGITPSMLRKWSAQREELEAAVAGLAASAQRRKLGSGRRPGFRSVDDALAAWVRRQRALGVAVKDRDMQEQARALAAAQGLVGFRASKGYISKFKTRNLLWSAGAAAVSSHRAPDAVVSAVAASAPAPAASGGSEAAGEPCLFGVDIGTTAVRCAVVSATSGAILTTTSAAIEAAGSSAAADGEQSVAAVLRAVHRAVHRLPTVLRSQVTSIGICGRMHGIMWWRCDAVGEAVDRLFRDSPQSIDAVGRAAPDASRAWSEYVTFLDQRCSPAFLDRCRAQIATSLDVSVDGWSSSRCSPIATGYGLATFAYMLEERPRELVGFDACGTIQDFVAFVLCRHSSPAATCMDTTDAFSWGGFDMTTQDWNPLAVAALHLPVHMLPAVRTPGDVIGHTAAGYAGARDVLGLPIGTPVFVPMGEHPCTVMAAISQADESADAESLTLVNIGTAAQLAMVLTADDVAKLDRERMHKSFEVRPFLSSDRFLGVAASLSGGNVFAWLVEQSLSWSRDLAVDPSFNQLSKPDMYARLIALGAAKVATDLEFRPTLIGERGEPAARGSFLQLQRANWSLGDMSAAACKGIIDNLFALVPPELDANLPRQQVIASGTALVRNVLLQHFLAKKAARASRPVRVREAADAAVGVAFTPTLLRRAAPTAASSAT